MRFSLLLTCICAAVGGYLSALKVVPLFGAAREHTQAGPFSSGQPDGTLSDVQVADGLLRLDSDDISIWEDAHTLILLRRTFSSIAAKKGGLHACSEAIRLIYSRNIPDELKRRAFSVALCGAVSFSPPTAEEFGDLLRLLSRNDALQCIDAFATWAAGGSAQQLQIGTEAWVASGQVLDSRAVDDLKAVAARSLAINGFLEDAFSAVLSVRDEKIRQCAWDDVAAILQLADVKQRTQFISRLASLETNAAIRVCTNSTFEISTLPDIIQSLHEKDRDQFIRDYLISLRLKTPLVAADVAQVLRGPQLGPGNASLLCSMLVKAGNAPLNDWLSELGVTQRAQLLDEVMKTSDSTGEFDSSEASETWIRARSAIPGGEDTIIRALSRVRGIKRRLMHPMVSGFSPEKRDEAFSAVYQLDIYDVDQLALDPGSVLSSLNLAPLGVRNQVLGQALARLANWDVNKALTIAKDHAEDSLIAQVLKAGVQTYSIPLQDRAGKLLTSLPLLRNESDQIDCVTGLFKSFGFNDPYEGVKMIGLFPTPVTREAAVLALAQSWSETDPINASEWIAELPPGPTRDKAIRALISQSSDDPERALSNARAIANPELRLIAATEVMRAWNRINPDVALSFAVAAGFSNEEITAIRRGAAKEDERK